MHTADQTKKKLTKTKWCTGYIFAPSGLPIYLWSLYINRIQGLLEMFTRFIIHEKVPNVPETGACFDLVLSSGYRGFFSPRGSPRTMWIGNITEWSGLAFVKATRKAQDRNYWRGRLIASDRAMGTTWQDVSCSRTRKWQLHIGRRSANNLPQLYEN